MSLYNMIAGVNPATFYVLPMLGHHGDWYPRFRDCFIEDGKIVVMTRTGGGNREGYAEENYAITQLPGYIRDEDGSFPGRMDDTYAFWYFDPPEKWADDFARFTSDNEGEISDAYVEHCKSVYPKIADKIQAQFDMWRSAAETEV